MRKYLLLLLLVSLPSMGATCYDTAMTQAAISDCAQAESQSLDKDLNTAYKAVLKRFAEKPGFREKLKKAQRAWIAFRDLELELVSSDGSISGMCRSNRQGQLNKERTAYLKSLLESQEGDGCAP